MVRINKGREIPKASQLNRQYLISVQMQTAFESALYEEITKQGLAKVEVAERLGLDEKEIRRLLDPHHASKMPRMAEILQRAGKRATGTTTWWALQDSNL